jgi:hypothetical protein
LRAGIKIETGFSKQVARDAMDEAGDYALSMPVSDFPTSAGEGHA